MDYKSKDIQRLFDISAETVRTWSEEFQVYLSPTATPGHGRHRVFSREDLEVFALVAEVKNAGQTYEDAHVQLKMGQRGVIPDLASEHGLVLQTNLELSKAEAIIMDLTIQRDEAVKKTRELEDEIIRLQTRLELAEQRVDELKETQTGRDDLLMQIGQLKARLEMEQEKNKSQADE